MSVAAADLTGDGRDDLVVVIKANKANVLLNNGDGTFALTGGYETGEMPFAITAADLNKDGKTDFAIANYQNNQVDLLFSKGNGTLEASSVFLPALGMQTASIAAADLNVDGVADLVVANQATDSLTVLLNDGAPFPPELVPSIKVATGGDAPLIAAADLNGDAMPDIALGNVNAAKVSVILSTGKGTFAPKVDYPTAGSAQSIATIDLNGDGKPDLVVGNGAPDTTVSVLLNSGKGTFAPRVDYPMGGDPRSIAIADLNGDGNLDLAFAIAQSSETSADSVSVLLNSGNGAFGPRADYKAGWDPSSIVAADMNGDGEIDLVVANRLGSTLSVLLNKGDGTFAPTIDHPTLERPVSIAAADVNGDAKPDIAVVTDITSVAGVLINNGDATFAPIINYEIGDGIARITAADVNGDGKLDLAVVSQMTKAVSVLLNSGNGPLVPSRYPLVFEPASIAVADLNGDGKPDLAITDTFGETISILPNSCQSSTTVE